MSLQQNYGIKESNLRRFYIFSRSEAAQYEGLCGFYHLANKLDGFIDIDFNVSLLILS